MKPKLTLRDLFWLVLVCAMGLGWWIDRSLLTAAISKLSKYAWKEHHEVTYWIGGEMHIRPK